MHKKNRKGFTLIELLAVIAIIAILVSIMTPLAIKYTSKANAATNAANMRSVKSTVAVMLVSGQINPESGNNSDRVYSALDQKISDSDNPLIDIFLKFAKAVISLVASDNTTFYASNGVLTIDGQSVAAPQAKAINVDGIKIRKGTEMTLTFVKSNGSNDYNDIIVTYDGMTIEAFAVVAADGDEAKIADIEHNFIDSNNDWICDICGEKFDFWGGGDHGYDDVGDGLGSNSHICSDMDDHICDNPDCGQTVEAHIDATGDHDHTCDKSGCSATASSCTTGSSCVCTECGAESHTDETGDTDCSGNPTSDGVCDNCGASV